MIFITVDQVKWNINFNMAAQGWEVGNFDRFFNVMCTLRLTNQGAIDTLWWVLTSKGKFSFFISFSHNRRIIRFHREGSGIVRLS